MFSTVRNIYVIDRFLVFFMHIIMHEIICPLPEDCTDFHISFMFMVSCAEKFNNSDTHWLDCGYRWIR